MNSKEQVASGRSKRSRGSAVALVAASTLVLAILGVAIFFLLLCVGGHREVSNATDAGALQVGRDSVTSPSINLQPTERRLAGLGDPRLGPDSIDLLAYNRLIGMALLVQMNATADDTAQARANAAALTSLIENPGGIADRLRTQLSVGGNFTASFNSAFQGNSTHMTGNEATGVHIPSQHAVAYTGQAGDDTRASNLNVGRLMNPGSSPVVNFRTNQSLPLAGDLVTVVDGQPYLSGYRRVPGGNQPLLAVPVLPNQPHLLSQRSFNGSTAFMPPATVVPPNSFRSHSTTTDRYGRENLSNAAAIAGVGNAVLLQGPQRLLPRQATTFNPEIPRGYITIYNNGQVLDRSGVLSAAPNGGGVLNFRGNVGDPTRNVAANELGKGIDLDPDTGFIALTQTGQLPAWKAHNVRHAGFPVTRNSSTNPPHYASLPYPVGISWPVWERVLVTDSHRDFCWRAYRGRGIRPMGVRAGIEVDKVDPLKLEERFGHIPAFNQIFDPRHPANPLMGLWRHPHATVQADWHLPQATRCNNGTIAPGPVNNCINAHWVPYHNLGTPLETLLDTNISSASPLGHRMYTYQQLDNAFYGCGGWSYGAPDTINNVTAAEAAKLAVFDAYGQGPRPDVPNCEDVRNSFVSGVRVYTPGADPGRGDVATYAIGAYHNAYSDPRRRGVVTDPGSLRRLFEQIEPGSSNRVRSFVASRMRQIKSETSEAEITQMMNVPIDTSGQPFYIYLDATNRFTLTQQPPPAASDVAIPTRIDGRVFPVGSRSYPLLDTMVNTRNDNDIHERLFMTVDWASGGEQRGRAPRARATERAQFGTSSGYDLELGKITFQQQADSDLQLCDRN